MSATGKAHDNSITHFHLGDLLTHGGHHTGALMTQDCGQRYGNKLVACDEIGMAEANAVNRYQYFVRTRFLDGGFFKAEGLMRGTRDSRGDLHVRYALISLHKRASSERHYDSLRLEVSPKNIGPVLSADPRALYTAER